MLSSSVSRREAAAARATKSGELPKSAAAISLKDVAATARSGELSKAVAGAWRRALQGGGRRQGGRGRAPRGMDGALRPPEDRQVLPHALLPAREQAARLLQEEAQGQHGAKSLLIDGNCRVEDRGLKNHHGQMIYVLCVYNQKEKEHQITASDEGSFHVQHYWF